MVPHKKVWEPQHKTIDVMNCQHEDLRIWGQRNLPPQIFSIPIVTELVLGKITEIGVVRPSRYC